MEQKREYTYFTKVINGVERTITCYTNKTKYGFNHHASIRYGETNYTAKVEYGNRTWETFPYETCISHLIKQLPESEQETYYNAFVKETAEKKREECDNFLNDFKKAHDALSPKAKQFFAEHTPTIETEKQANFILTAMKMASIFEALG